MSVRRIAENQPEHFEFTPENKIWADEQLKKYPEGRQQSAVIPYLWRAQKQHDNWLPRVAIEYIASLLSMPAIRVYEIATFYTMFNLAPVGKFFIQVCGTTPCMLRGSEDLISVCKDKIAQKPFEVRKDGMFSWLEVECLGACANAPMAQINDDYYEDLTPESLKGILENLESGIVPRPGSKATRHASEPLGGATVLQEFITSEGAVEPMNATVAMGEKMLKLAKS